MATFFDLLNSYNGQSDKEIDVSDQTLTAGVALQSNQWQRIINVATTCTRPATTKRMLGTTKYTAGSELGVVVDCGKSEIVLQGTTAFARLMFKGFYFVNGRLKVECKNWYEWHCKHEWNWNDWGLVPLTYQGAGKSAVVNVTPTGGGGATITRVSGDTFASGDVYANTRFRGFVRIYGAGAADGYVANNMLFARMSGYTNSNTCTITSSGDTPLSKTSVVMEWGAFPEQTVAGPRGLDAGQSTSFFFLGSRMGQTSTGLQLQDAKDFWVEGCLFDDQRNPQDDLYRPDIPHVGDTSADDVHNESITSYGGGRGKIRWSRFRGSLNRGYPNNQSASVRPIIKTATQSTDPHNPFDVEANYIDLVDAPNGGILQFNDNATGFNGQSKALIGNIRTFVTGATPAPTGAQLTSNVMGVNRYDENILTQDSSRVALTKASTPMCQYRIPDPGNGNYYDQQWGLYFGYDAEDIWMNSVGFWGPPAEEFPGGPYNPATFGAGAIAVSSVQQTQTMAVPSSATVGRKLWAVCGGSSAGSSFLPKKASDGTTETGWTLEKRLDDGNFISAELYSRTVQAGDATSYRFDVTTGNLVLGMFTTGLHEATYLDAPVTIELPNSHSPTANTNMTATSLTPSRDKIMSVVIYITDNLGGGMDLSTPSGYTTGVNAKPASGSACSLHISYKENISAATGTVTAVSSVSDQWGSFHLLLRGNTGAGATGVLGAANLHPTPQDVKCPLTMQFGTAELYATSFDYQTTRFEFEAALLELFGNDLGQSLLNLDAQLDIASTAPVSRDMTGQFVSPMLDGAILTALSRDPARALATMTKVLEGATASKVARDLSGTIAAQTLVLPRATQSLVPGDLGYVGGIADHLGWTSAAFSPRNISDVLTGENVTFESVPESAVARDLVPAIALQTKTFEITGATFLARNPFFIGEGVSVLPAANLSAVPKDGVLVVPSLTKTLEGVTAALSAKDLAKDVTTLVLTLEAVVLQAIARDPARTIAGRTVTFETANLAALARDPVGVLQLAVGILEIAGTTFSARDTAKVLTSLSRVLDAANTNVAAKDVAPAFGVISRVLETVVITPVGRDLFAGHVSPLVENVTATFVARDASQSLTVLARELEATNISVSSKDVAKVLSTLTRVLDTIPLQVQGRDPSAFGAGYLNFDAAVATLLGQTPTGVPTHQNRELSSAPVSVVPQAPTGVRLIQTRVLSTANVTLVAYELVGFVHKPMQLLLGPMEASYKVDTAFSSWSLGKMSTE